MSKLTPKQMARAQELAEAIFKKFMPNGAIPPIDKSTRQQAFVEGFVAGISDINKDVEVLIEALEWNAYTICLHDIYKHENNEQNKINLLCNIRKAKEALAKFRSGDD